MWVLVWNGYEAINRFTCVTPKVNISKVKMLKIKISKGRNALKTKMSKKALYTVSNESE
jgi:hypothetical protein